MRPRLGGLPYLADRATRVGGLPHLSCKHDQIKMRDYMERRVTPPRRVTSPTWGPPPPCKQALRLQNSPKLPHIHARFYCNANDDVSERLKRHSNFSIRFCCRIEKKIILNSEALQNVIAQNRKIRTQNYFKDVKIFSCLQNILACF